MVIPQCFIYSLVNILILFHTNATTQLTIYIYKKEMKSKITKKRLHKSNFDARKDSSITIYNLHETP